MLTLTDWRLPENRREAFQRSYTFSLEHKNFPGMVYSMLPAIADAFELDEDGRAWLAWLNGNTQNVVASMLILEAAPRHTDWRKAIDFWSEHFKALEFDTDRRHQKSRFGDATESWFMDYGYKPAEAWRQVSDSGVASFRHAMAHPYMGRISAWSFMEFARILLPYIPDVDSWYLEESSSRSHRNALCLLSGYDDAWGWDREQSDIPFMLDLLPALHDLAEDLLQEADVRNGIPPSGDPEGDGAWEHHPLVSRLSMESALCTYKSWHKPDRRYPNVYADMMYQRIKKAEARMGRSLDLLWQIRKETLPEFLRVEANPYDPGLSQPKQNLYRETGEIMYLWHDFADMEITQVEYEFHTLREAGPFKPRKDPTWT